MNRTLVPVETGWVPWNGRRLYYEVHGSGQETTVLLHGLLVSSAMNRQFASNLARRGHRIVLLDLLGHGKSDRPEHASEYRFDVYTEQVLALLDHLDVPRAVVGGVSLGANVALLFATLHPDRVGGLVVEMPVLEWAVPSAALTFVPLLLGAHYARRPLRPITDLCSRLPRTGRAVDSLLDALSTRPEAASAILHGILVGPVAPTVDARHGISAPTLVIGHRADLIHPFSDAENLTEQIPNARLVRGWFPFGMRIIPDRLLDAVASFLDDLDDLDDLGAGPVSPPTIDEREEHHGFRAQETP
ncbi:MAG: alpha/beta hydrolase [Acidimicrobiales bacterium]|nr:alpha/beta hydrolase [Acidimicrobiales bacterium]